MRDEISAFFYLYIYPTFVFDPTTQTENLKRLLQLLTTLKLKLCDLITAYSADGVLLDTSAWMRGPISMMGPLGSLSSSGITRGSAW